MLKQMRKGQSLWRAHLADLETMSILMATSASLDSAPRASKPRVGSVLLCYTFPFFFEEKEKKRIWAARALCMTFLFLFFIFPISTRTTSSSNDACLII